MRKTLVAVLVALALGCGSSSDQIATSGTEGPGRPLGGNPSRVLADAELVTITTAPPTTTTTARKKVTASSSGSAVGYSGNPSGSVNGYPCGNDLPPCYVLARESGGNPTAENPISSASGLWQFLDGTWAGFGGYGHASWAPASVQNEKARLVWAGGAGCFHWSAC